MKTINEEKCKKALKNITSKLNNDDIFNLSNDIHILLEAFKKRVPRVVNPFIKNPHSMFFPEHGNFYCPNCGTYLPEFFKSEVVYNYCPKCGVEFDWDTFKKENGIKKENDKE